MSFSGVHNFGVVQGQANSAVVDTYTGSLALTDGVLSDTHTVGARLQSVTSSGKGAVPAGLSTALQTALSTTLKDTTNTGVGSVGISFNLQNGLTDFLSTGESLTVVYTVTVSDGHGGIVMRPVTFVVTGTNDAPVISSADVIGADHDGPSTQNHNAWGWGQGAAAVLGDINFSDANVDDTHTAVATLVSAIPSSGSVPAPMLSALGAALKLHLNGDQGGKTNDVNWGFIAPTTLASLPVGESLLVQYIVQIADTHGATASQPITLLLNSGSTQPVIVSGVTAAQINEVSEAAPASLDAASGTVGLTAGGVSEIASLSSKLAFVNWSGGAAIPAASLAALNSALSLSLLSMGDSDNDANHPDADDSVATGASWSFSAADHVFNFMTAGQTLTLAYEVTGKDAYGEPVTRLVTITLNGAYHAPVLAPDGASHIASDLAGGAGSATPDTMQATLNFTSSSLTDAHTVSIGAPTASWSGGSAIPAATLSALQSAVSATLTDSTHTGSGAVALTFSAADGLFHFLSQGESLTVTYNVTVADSHGGTSIQPVTFTVTGVDDAPTIAPAPSEQVNEDAALSVAAATLLATASDPNLNNALTLTSVGGAQNGTVSLANGVVTFTPNADFFGAAAYTYTVTDSHGQSTTATAAVQVNPVSETPTLKLVDATGAENMPISLSIGATAPDSADHITSLVVSALPVGAILSDGAGGHSFTAMAGATQVDVGAWALAKLTLTPPTSFVGTIPLTVTTTWQVDNAAPASATGTLTVTSTLDHAPPVAVDDLATVNEGTAKTVNVLLNDTDPAGLTLAVSGVTSAAHGTVVVNANNTITYTPNAGYLGADSFTYTASDSQGATSAATVNLTVQSPSPAVAPLISVGSNTTIIPTDGSAVKTALTLHAGDVVSFNWTFATTDWAPYKDFAFASVNGSAFMLADTQSVGNVGASGAHTFTYTAPVDGTYTIGAGVMNDQDQNMNSYLEVDHLAVNGVTVQNFANGLTGLNGVTSTALGDVQEVAQGVVPTGVTLAPATGGYEAFLTSDPILETNIESFLGLAQGALQNIAASTGVEYTPILVPMSVTVVSNNPDDTYVTISGAPMGSVFNHGVYDQATNTWKIEASDLGGDLTLTTPSNYSGSFCLSVTATSVSYGTHTSATSPVQMQLVTVMPAAVTIDGSAGAQTLVGGSVAGNTLIGGPGDTLTGGSASDTFVFNGAAFGKNIITDFDTNTDVLQFSHTIFADTIAALNHATQVGSDVVITFDSNDSVTLKNVLLASLHASDFHII